VLDEAKYKRQNLRDSLAADSSSAKAKR
jgi:hypothetical protein